MKTITITLLPLFFTLFMSLPVKAQNSSELINEGIKLHDESKFEEALEVYNKVSRNDSNYVWALAEKAITFNALKEYQKTIEICNLGLSYNTSYNTSFYNNLGTAYDYLEEKEKALEVYLKSVEEYPYNYLLNFNLAITYEGLKNIDKAIETYKKAIDLNIYYASSHYRLGKLMVEQGRIVPAMYALSFYNLLDNRSERSRDAIKTLQDISNGLVKKSEILLAEDEPLDELDMIIRSKLALNKNYKAVVKIDDPYIKQLQVLCEKSPVENNTQNFWLKTYAPYFKNLYSSKFLEYHTYYVFNAYNNKTITKWLNKNKSKNDDFINWAREQLNSIRQFTYIMYKNKPYKAQQWFYDNNSISAIGNLDSKDGNTVYIGPWKYFTKSGRISTIGERDDKGQRQGEWKWYFENGNLQEVCKFIDNKWNGQDLIYHENGILNQKTNYKNDSIEGKLEKYYKTGQLSNEAIYSNNKIIGSEKFYYESGNLKSEYFYKNGKIDSIANFYFENGKPSTIIEVKNETRNGNYISYYENGNIDSKGLYKNDLPIGEWKWHYESGELKSEGVYNDNGKLEGLFSRYNKKGSLEQTENYSNGILEGVFSEYNEDGKAFSELIYSNDIIQSYKFFNPDDPNTVYTSGEIKNNKLEYKSVYPNGIIRSEGMTKGEDPVGLWKYYVKNGALNFTQDYAGKGKNNKIEYFFIDKRLKSSLNSIDDNYEGIATYYHRNSTISAQGNYKKGQQEGEWLYYNEWNKRVSNSYYLKGILKGYQSNYHQDGKLFRETLYVDGIKSKFYTYDTLSNLIQELEFKNGTGYINFLAFDSTLQLKSHYKNGLRQGKFIWYYSDGSIEQELEFANDKETGIIRDYFPNRNLNFEGKYENGNKEGIWNYYYKNGNKKTCKNFRLGLLNGKITYYHENGKIEIEGKYNDDEKDGEFIFYAPNGDIQLKKIYQNGVLTSYSYLDKDGNYVEPIQLKNETGKILAYYKNGTKSWEQEIVLGEYVGDKYVYFSNGTILSKSYFINNELDGLLIEYYENGKPKYEINYKYDYLHGDLKYYSENGVLKRVENYLYNEKNGIWQYYDDNENLVKTEKYKYGRKIK